MTPLTISIVNWNTCEQLCTCLLSLREATRDIGARVVVVDNASEDGSARMVAREFPEVCLHASPRNLGFAGGNNVVLREQLGEYVLVLNPDVQVSREGLERLLDFMGRTPTVAAAAPVLVGADGAEHAYLYRRFPSVAQLVLFWTVLAPLARQVSPLRRRYLEHDLRGSRPRAVDQIPGAAMLIRASALRSVGEMDPGYFIWFEDVDWCYRARQAGYKLYILPTARFRHEGGASFRSWSMQTRVFQFYRTFFRFLCKHRLDGLRRIALPLLSADLYVKELVLRLARSAGFKNLPDVSTLSPTRKEMRDVVRRWTAGELVSFSDASVPEPNLEHGKMRSGRSAIVA